MRATRLPGLLGLLLLPLAAALGGAWAAAAEGDEDANPPQEDIRFDLFKADGEVFRFDRKTGEILKIVKTKEGFVAVPQPVRIVGKLLGKIKPDLPFALPQTSVKGASEAGMAQFDSSAKKPSGATIEFFDEQGNDITYQVTDQDREAAKGAILAYQDSLSLIQTLDSRDKISGNILVRNKGEKKLKVLELTLQIHIVGREKPEEHRFLYVDRPGEAGPPQPAEGGREGNAVLQKVDLPCPPGGLMGSPVVKVSYLKFAE